MDMFGQLINRLVDRMDRFGRPLNQQGQLLNGGDSNGQFGGGGFLGDADDDAEAGAGV